MRKKSHVALSIYLVNNLESDLLENHKKAFIMGSVLPDCKLSFVTTRHNMEETFDTVCSVISELSDDLPDKASSSYCRKLGEVTHYVADYFTFPHNKTFNGNIRQHCKYEKQLKMALSDYIKSEQINENKEIAAQFDTSEDLCRYVEQLHGKYLMASRDIDSDCRYIVTLCHIVVEGVLNLTDKNVNVGD